MKYSTAHNNINEAYYSYYNTNLAFIYIAGEIMNPIVKAYVNAELSLKEAVTLIHSKVV